MKVRRKRDPVEIEFFSCYRRGVSPFVILDGINVCILIDLNAKIFLSECANHKGN